MCLGIPMKILKIEKDKALVSVGNIKKRIAINFLTNPQIGDYVIVHAGFAIEKLNPEKAEETLEMIEGLGSVKNLTKTTGIVTTEARKDGDTGKVKSKKAKVKNVKS